MVGLRFEVIRPEGNMKVMIYIAMSLTLHTNVCLSNSKCGCPTVHNTVVMSNAGMIEANGHSSIGGLRAI